jgi:flagellar basal-body rod modification protein FlgD
MAAVGAILTQHMAGQANGIPRAMSTSASDPGGTGNAASDSASISANDFLTLLVTEMQNQDPTATTDPNEYINQLVQVNSLQQLIGINQTLTGALGAPSSDANNGSTGHAVKADSLLSAPTTEAKAAISAPAGNAACHAKGQGPASSAVSGNLGIPAENPAAYRVASALDRQSGPAAAAVQSRP